MRQKPLTGNYEPNGLDFAPEAVPKDLGIAVYSIGLQSWFLGQVAFRKLLSGDPQHSLMHNLSIMCRECNRMSEDVKRKLLSQPKNCVHILYLQSCIMYIVQCIMYIIEI